MRCFKPDTSYDACAFGGGDCECYNEYKDMLIPLLSFSYGV